jgi:hypothetical protein
MLSEEYKVATHEAGHAVVAAAVGSKVSKVRAGRTSGHIKHSLPDHKTVEHCAINYAGWLADRRSCGLSRAEADRRASGDEAIIERFLQGASQAEKAATRREGLQLASEIYRVERFTTIPTIAETLAAQGILGGPTLQRLLAGVNPVDTRRLQRARNAVRNSANVGA